MPNHNLEKTHEVELWNADLDLLFEFCLLHVTDYFEVIAEIWQFVIDAQNFSFRKWN